MLFCTGNKTLATWLVYGNVKLIQSPGWFCLTHFLGVTKINGGK